MLIKKHKHYSFLFYIFLFIYVLASFIIQQVAYSLIQFLTPLIVVNQSCLKDEIKQVMAVNRNGIYGRTELVGTYSKPFSYQNNYIMLLLGL